MDLQVEPPRKRFRPISDQTVSQKTRTTPTLDRVALLSQVNWKDRQIIYIGENDAQRKTVAEIL